MAALALLYATAALLLVRLVAKGSDPFWINAAPAHLLLRRVRCALDRDLAMPLRSRIFILFRVLLFTVTVPFFTALWTLDDLLFSGYRGVALRKPVFIVGGFRTGTTSLHRSLALDTQRFASPRFIELAFPFVSLQLFLALLEKADATLGTACIKAIESRLQALIGEDVMARHPMNWYAAEEDDVLMMAYHSSGYYAQLHCPAKAFELEAGNYSAMPAAAQRRAVVLYRRTMQKWLWVRGGGRQLLSKSHLIELMPLLHAEFADAHFVGIQRHPKDALVSWYALSRAAGRVISTYEPPRAEALDMHLAFWDRYFAAESAFFADAKLKLPGEGGAGDGRKVSMRFDAFVKDRRATLESVYGAMGIRDFAATALGRALDSTRAKAAHDNYKAKHSYRNPTLEDLGVDLRDLEDRFSDYMAAAGIARTG